jgi:hypothetical protein
MPNKAQSNTGGYFAAALLIMMLSLRLSESSLKKYPAPSVMRSV